MKLLGQCFLALLLGVNTGPCSAVGNVSGNRCKSDADSVVASLIPARSQTYVAINHEMTSMVIFSLPMNHPDGLLLTTSESMCTKYWLTACSSLPKEKVWLGELTMPP